MPKKQGTDYAVRRAFRALPLRQRCLLRLIYHRGASLAELAGALGMSRSSLKWTLNQALGQAADPLHRGMVDCWDRLTGREQRLLYLHRILGLSLRKIVREGLMDPAPPRA